MAVNVCHDIASRSRRGVVVPLEEAETAPRGAAPGGQQDIEEAVARDERRRLVQAALSTLPERERAAIVLRDIEELSSPEVARILGSSEEQRVPRSRARGSKIKRFIEARQEQKP